MTHWKIYKDVDLYFITNTVTEWLPVFIEPKYFSILVDSLKYSSIKKGLSVHAYVIMPNHIHALVSMSPDTDGRISDVMRDFKRFTSRSISESLQNDNRSIFLKTFRARAIEDNSGNRFRIWNEGYHPIAIESEKFYRQKIDYIHLNPGRKGYVLKPEHWYYSSARNYARAVNVAMEVELLL